MHGIVRRYHHHTHVTLFCGITFTTLLDTGCIVGVPFRVEQQLGGYTATVRRLGNSHASLLVKEALGVHCIDTGVIQIVVTFGLGQVLTVRIGGAETLQQLVEHADLRLFGYQFSHIGQWRHHFCSTVDETVGTADVVLYDINTIDTGIARLTVGLAIEQEIVVFVSDTVVRQLCFQEQQHRNGRTVFHADHVLATLTMTLPVFVVWHVLRSENGHCVILAQSRETTHSLTFLQRITLNRRQTIQLDGVVEHVTEQQHLFLGLREVLVTLDPPRVVGIESLISSIICHKKRLRTRLTQHFLILQVVNHLHGVGEIALFVEPAVNAVTPTFRGFLVEVVLLT